MVDFEYKSKYDVYDFKKIITLLRSEDGCPWDREQTHESIRRNFIEEVYEVIEAIDEKSTEHLQEELGDVLMQVLFHADIEEEAGNFNVDDVADAACKKLILRHPHVFGSTDVKNSDEVLVNWEKIKREEKKQETVASSLEAVAKSLPALWRAEKVQKKAAKVGFDWTDIDGALDKLEEEIAELRSAVCSGTGAAEELGDLLFSAVNTARFLNTDPEDALNASCDKFIARFTLLEQLLEKNGHKFEDLTLDQLDKFYNEAKETLANS